MGMNSANVLIVMDMGFTGMMWQGEKNVKHVVGQAMLMIAIYAGMQHVRFLMNANAKMTRKRSASLSILLL